jgi:hypothetical protein
VARPNNNQELGTSKPVSTKAGSAQKANAQDAEIGLITTNKQGKQVAQEKHLRRRCFERIYPPVFMNTWNAQLFLRSSCPSISIHTRTNSRENAHSEHWAATANKSVSWGGTFSSVSREQQKKRL